jgi:hypothetical protein
MRKAALLLFLASLAFLASAADGVKTTRAVLNKYFDDMNAAWQTYPSDKQKEVRDAQLKMLQDTFNKEIAAAEAPPNSTLTKIVTAYVASLDKVILNFRQEKQATLRAQYLLGCGSAFKRETATASDLAAPRTTQQVFELMLSMMEEARNGVRANQPDVQKQLFDGVNQAIGLILPQATVPEKGDPITQFDENLKEARRRFSVTDKSKVNEIALAWLESRAKEIQQIAVKKVK